jgi:pimeloyl-ACP methyl ester carboxylesterase
MAILHSLILGEGEPLLILHGFFGMGDNWKTLANRFAENYEVHLIDQRNHGRSFHSDDFSYDLMAEDLLAYCKHHELTKVSLLGHSMGGKTAMLFAVKNREFVTKLIVADIAPKYYPPHHQFILEALHAVDFSKMESRNDIDDVFKKYIPESGIRLFLLKNVYRKSKENYAFRFNLDSLTENIEEVGTELPSMTIFEGDTLFLRGENSNYIKKEDEALIHAHFPNSEIITVAKAGHWLHAENPNEFYNYVVQFLEKH